MTNNQNNPNQEPNQLSDDELEAVAGGERFPKVDEYIDVAKDFIGNVKEAGKDAISGVRDILDLGEPC